jgi:DNA-binding XRE family transcriptional regulator
MVAHSDGFGYKIGMDMANQSSEPSLAPEAEHPLVTYRKSRDLTQAQPADELDVARETVARWETGRRIDDKLLPRVSERTGIARGVLRPDLAVLLGTEAAR